jgi:uncharacterized YigZ family protein
MGIGGRMIIGPRQIPEVSLEQAKRIPAKQTQVELRIINSRFIATAAPVLSVDEARDFIAKIRTRYNDASHNVPVYIIGHGASTTTHSSDDGEPSGTAGRPALAVLQGSGIGDIAVVITRYFGGTKLGTGGLVRAYSDSMRAVLEALPLAEKVRCHDCTLNLPYSLYEQTKQLILSSQGEILDEAFTDKVHLRFRIAVSGVEQLQDAVRELSRGTMLLAFEREDYDAFVSFHPAQDS